MMRKGFADPRIAASPHTASYNMGLFVDLEEFPPHFTSTGWKATLGIAMELEQIRLRHAAERRAGRRAY